MIGRPNRFLTGEVHQALRRDILRCRLRPGELLSEAALASRFGVSKTPIREALNHLAEEGLVVVIPFKGYLVSSIGLKDLQDLYFLRTVLETAAVELAAQVATQEELDRLEALASGTLEGAAEDSLERIAEANHGFHVAVAEASHNPRLARLVVHTLEQLGRVLYLDLKFVSPEETHEEHLAVVAALRRGDKSAARQLVSDHIERSKQRMLQSL